MSMVLVNTSLVMAVPPPPSDAVNGIQYIEGDWTVAGSESYTNEVIFLTGNLTIPVGATLTLTNTTILMNTSAAFAYHVEVNGTLVMHDGGDGYTPMDAMDSDSSNITANNTANAHYFWINSGANVQISNSQIHYVGDNTNIPPDTMGGIYITSNNVQIQNSLIADNQHGLIFDSVMPALLQDNNISDNAGIGLAIFNTTTSGFDATGTISNNNIITNTGAGILISVDTVNLEMFGLNVSENGFGVNVVSNGTVTLNVHDCMIWRNDGSSGSGYAGFYVMTSNGTSINVTVENNEISENTCGGIHIGYDTNKADIAPWNALVTVRYNRIFGNNAGWRLNAQNNLVVTIEDNYLGGSSYLSEGGQFIIGYNTQGINNAPCNNVTLNLINNEFNYGLPSDFWEISHAFRTGAVLKLDVTIDGNIIDGAGELMALFLIGEDWNDYVLPETIIANVMNNEIRIKDDDSNDVDTRQMYVFNALNNIELNFHDNYYWSQAKLDFMTSWEKGGLLWAGTADWVNASIENNTFILDPIDFTFVESADTVAGLIYVWADVEVDCDINYNYFEVYDIADDYLYCPYFIMIGQDESFWDNADCENITLDFIGNEIIQTIVGGGQTGVGTLRVMCNDQLTANLIGNDITLNHLGDSSGGSADFEGVFKIGDWDGDGTANDVYLICNDNNIQGNFGTNVDAGGAMRVDASNNITVEMNNNVMQGWWSYPPADESNAYDFGVRIGYWCYSSGINAENVVVTMNNNIIGPGGVGSAIIVGANNNVTFTADGGEVIGALYGDCGSTGSFGVEHTYGNGITLLAENCIDADINNLDIYENRGAGIFIESVNDADVDIMNCDIYDNDWHGIYMRSQNGKVNADGSIEECAIYDNGDDWNGDLGEYGSGLWCEEAIVDLVNCTFDNPLSDYELELIGESNVTALNTTFNKNNVYIEGVTQALLRGNDTYADTTLTNWDIISDGSFRITIDGDTQNIDGIDFTVGAPMAVMANAATVIQNALQAVGTGGYTGATCTWSNGQNRFMVRSGTFGVSSTITYLTTSTGTVGTDISGLTASPNGYWMACNNGTIEPGTGSWLDVYWFMHVKAEQLGTGFGLPLTDITVTDDTPGVVGTGITANDGFRRWFVVNEYYETTTVKTFYTPHTADAVKGAATGSTIETMDMSKDVIVILDYVTLPPIADAGPDQTVNDGVNITFDGSGSTDDFWIANWTWVIAGVTNGTYYGETVTIPSLGVGVYNVTLTVTDAEGYTDTDNVIITVVDVTPPVANAGPDQTVDEDTVVTFDGSGSTDDVGIVNYTWTFTDGTAQTLYGVAPTYTFAEPGVYTVNLMVTDAVGLSDNDTVVITVLDTTAPIPDPGVGQTIPEGGTVVIDGSGSQDNDGVVDYTWTFNDGVNDVVVDGPILNHTFLLAGNYTITLTCTDAAGNSASSTTYVVVNDVTAPFVFVVAPGDDLSGIPLDWSLVIVFSEPMDTASVEAAFAITGTTVTSFVWDDSDTYVTVNLDVLTYETTYTFSVNPKKEEKPPAPKETETPPAEPAAPPTETTPTEPGDVGADEAVTE